MHKSTVAAADEQHKISTEAKHHSTSSSTSASMTSSSCQLFDSNQSNEAHTANVNIMDDYITSQPPLPPQKQQQQQQQQQQPPPAVDLLSNDIVAMKLTNAAAEATTKSMSTKYGELIVLGYNGCIDKPICQTKNDQHYYQANSSRRKSKFVLKKRDLANGVKPASQHICQTTQEVNDLMMRNQHSVAFTLSRNHTVIVQYESDDKTDMFQIGRSSESAIDFIVLDTQVPGGGFQSNGSSPNGSPNSSLQQQANSNQQQSPPSQQSTISRFSCRIVVEREPPYTARIYAAGFDSSKRIFLGEKATKWKNEKGQFDGVTTNGVLIMHPTDGFINNTTESKSNEWMEVSVCGAVFSLNESRLTPCLNTFASSKDINNNNSSNNVNIIENKNHDAAAAVNDLKSNVLRDGTLIDLCGATLLWRSTESLARTPTKHYLDVNLEHLNRLKPQCPVGLKTLVFPSSASPIAQQLRAAIIQQHQKQTGGCSGGGGGQKNFRLEAMLNGNYSKEFKKHINLASSYYQQLGDRIPMVYLKCGHVHGQHDWGVKRDNERECPLCRKIGPYVQLLVGLEPSFYCDTDIKISNNSQNCTLFKPYAFRPCGHMASEQTCKYWSRIMVPQGTTQGLLSICPFCAVPLCKEQPFVKLIFQEAH